jgi:hypothetical protein
VYLGGPGYGKTWLAKAELLELRAQRPCGAVVIDSAGVALLEDIPEALTLRETLEAAFGRGELVRWTPRSVDEFDRFLLAARKPGGILILVDELSFWRWSKQLDPLCRTWRHARTSLFLTCQHVGADLAQGMLACNPKIRIFNVSAPRSLEWLERWHQLDTGAIRAQGVGEYILKDFSRGA